MTLPAPRAERSRPRPSVDADVVIVGGGPAGAATALSLARADPTFAARILVLEKARFPRDKPCAGAIGARGDQLLAQLGVSVRVPSVPVDGISFRAAEGETVACPGAIGRVVRRVEFDHALAQSLAPRGIRLRDGVPVEAVRDLGSDGVLLTTQGGDLRARVVVGCDGVGSVVRRSLGVGPGRLRAQVIEVDTEPVPGDRDRSLLHFDSSDRRLAGYGWDFPTVVGGRALVCRGVYRLKGSEGDGAHLDIATLLADRLRAIGIDPGACENKRYAERGFEPATRLARGAMMLVGEAAGIDALTGEGIAQAIEYGVLAGRFLARTLAQNPERQVDTSEWHAAVTRSRLARDLRIRARFLRYYYGPLRSELERFAVECPMALLVGARHFGARPPDWLAVGQVVGRCVARLARARLARAFT